MIMFGTTRRIRSMTRKNAFGIVAKMRNMVDKLIEVTTGRFMS